MCWEKRWFRLNRLEADLRSDRDGAETYGAQAFLPAESIKAQLSRKTENTIDSEQACSPAPYYI